MSSFYSLILPVITYLFELSMCFFLSVINHNASCQQTGQEPIHSVLCPGLGTAVGRMPFKRCALQVLV